MDLREKIKRIVYGIETYGRQTGYTEDAINQLAALLLPQWIPVSERLPEEEDRYAIIYITTTSKRPRIFIGDYVIEGDLSYWTNKLNAEVTHWLPLPQPPKDIEEIEEHDCDDGNVNRGTADI